ncbi:putative nuclease HARBI1 [Cucumis melo var. makuwa]|uniref:Nuclease HARBI1 n=1 Tax=Cucumis melo var. makuwa TaxID=1194695 RepID=A0A5A7V9B2_CUCMM|nr:putative nuclease HARBI1 [Cucumis melo var. makuwa]
MEENDYRQGEDASEDRKNMTESEHRKNTSEKVLDGNNTANHAVACLILQKYHVKNKDIWKFLDGIYFKKEKLELGGDQYKSYDVKNRVARRHFAKSGETVSRHFNVVLNAVLRLHEILLKQPNPVTHSCSHEKWQWFHNFLGALDGTHIKLNVSMSDRPRWEGYAFDSRVLRDAVSRPTGLKVPKGYYYLCDAGYPNAEGFLAP